VERVGELKRIEGADWHLEMGAISEMFGAARPDGPPALLFDSIPGYPKGHRVVWGTTNSKRRFALAFGLTEPRSAADCVTAYRDRMKGGFALIPPKEVRTGPILENVDRDDAVDLFKFPIPTVHEKDGGRYLGTQDLVVMRDPDSGWVNIGTYRVQVFDKNTVGLWMSPGKHGRLIRDRYFAKGEPCPVAISVGTDPLLFLSAGNEIDYGVSEYAYAGGHRGRPFEVVKTELYGLPVPARDEIVLEGEILPDLIKTEGPFGEFTGYYASGEQANPAVRIRRVCWRNDPIITTARPGRPPHDYAFSKCVTKAATIWDEIEKAGLPGVKGVWSHEAGGARLINIVSIKQLYPGHARQAGHLVNACHAGNYVGRWVIVVDDDIDPTNTFDVMWALASRCDPVEDIDFIRKSWSSPLDPLVGEGGMPLNSRAIVVACRPWERREKFPPVAAASKELIEAAEKKWRHLLEG
ncbi:MAG: UbiD family decarboxylase, partial [Alphaproteobacteria bacterium]|nr:UbiD family decarboxylase [Alphaproteobacteria bacterium]